MPDRDVAGRRRVRRGAPGARPLLAPQRRFAVTSAEEARRWLASAEDELEFARYSARGGYSAHACFAAQQAAEKAVKAVHYAAGARMVLGSSVRSLIV